MKTRLLAYTLLPAIAMAEEATTVPADEPMLPPLPAELLAPHETKAGLPATAQPIVSYKAPANEEQTWLKLLPVKSSEDWPSVFHRIAESITAKDMEMCHGYALWLRGQELVYLRYDDDLSLSGIHADGLSYGVLYVEFSPYGVRACPMSGYDLKKRPGGICWQDAPTRLWSWAESGQFWAELPKLLQTDKNHRATSAQSTAISREVATTGKRMVVFWATSGYSASAWWANFQRLYAEVGPRRFSLISPDGLKFLNDVQVPRAKSAPAPTPPPASTGKNAADATLPPPVVNPAALQPSTAEQPAAQPTATMHAAQPTAAKPAQPAQPAPPATPTTATPATAAAQPAAAPAKPAKQAEAHPIPDVLHPATGTEKDKAPAASVRPWDESVEKVDPNAPKPARKPKASTPKPAATEAPAAPAAPAAAPAEAPAAPAAAPAPAAG